MIGTEGKAEQLNLQPSNQMQGDQEPAAMATTLEGLQQMDRELKQACIMADEAAINLQETKEITAKEFEEATGIYEEAIKRTKLLITEEQAQTMEEAVKRDNHERRRKGSKGQGPRTTTAGLTKWLQERVDFIYEGWKERSRLQIEKEKGSGLSPKQKRLKMRQPQVQQRQPVPNRRTNNNSRSTSSRNWSTDSRRNTNTSSDGRTAAVPPIARPWGGDLFTFAGVARQTVALEQRAATCFCPRIPPSQMA